MFSEVAKTTKSNLTEICHFKSENIHWGINSITTRMSTINASISHLEQMWKIRVLQENMETDYYPSARSEFFGGKSNTKVGNPDLDSRGTDTIFGQQETCNSWNWL